tara:strand:- start:1750 stop:1953 length:204 start_codon:yes stop_codon:yes gene_type:complete
MSRALLHLKHKDEIVIALEKELSMKEYLMRNYEKNETLIDVCTGRISALKWVLGFENLDNQGEENDN